MWSGRRLTNIHSTTRPENVSPEVWTHIGKAAQKRVKQEWANEEQKPDHARRMNGIYSHDLDDDDYKEIIKNARRKLEVHVDAALPCKKVT